MDKYLYLLRGLPSSGKDTVAATITNHHFAADDYFYVDGEYRYNKRDVKKAHRACQNAVKYDMQSGYEKIAVCNTFTQAWEMEAYFDLAAAYGYTVFVLTVNRFHDNKNDHNVPDEAVENMRERFEHFL